MRSLKSSLGSRVGRCHFSYIFFSPGPTAHIRQLPWPLRFSSGAHTSFDFLLGPTLPTSTTDMVKAPFNDLISHMVD